MFAKRHLTSSKPFSMMIVHINKSRCGEKILLYLICSTHVVIIDILYQSIMRIIMIIIIIIIINNNNNNNNNSNNNNDNNNNNNIDTLIPTYVSKLIMYVYVNLYSLQSLNCIHYSYIVCIVVRSRSGVGHVIRTGVLKVQVFKKKKKKSKIMQK